MSTADQWDFTVPDSDAELRRHGVSPGRHLHVSVAPEEQELEAHEATPRRLSFAGSIQAEPDLSERTDDYLRGFGQTWSWLTPTFWWQSRTPGTGTMRLRWHRPADFNQMALPN